MFNNVNRGERKGEGKWKWGFETTVSINRAL
jgi:hypothetical protein